MPEKRKKRYCLIWTLCMAFNIWLVLKINATAEVRENWQNVYVRELGWQDILLIPLIGFVVCLLTRVFLSKCVPNVTIFFCHMIQKRETACKHLQWQVFGILSACYFFFFLVFYPGTAMNDTIYILESPWKTSAQHPILYNLYTWGLYCLGCSVWNANLGLALISLLQMAGMAFVLTRAIMLLAHKGARPWWCRLMALYFGASPLFPTYAVSAIKDTPFAICLFALLLLLYELADTDGRACLKKRWLVEYAVCVFGIISFRNNGMFIVLGLGVILWCIYRTYRKSLLTILGGGNYFSGYYSICADTR